MSDKETQPDKTPFLAGGSDFSLSKYVGKKIVDVTGYPSGKFGPGVSTFKISWIIFEDGTKVSVEGEHDFPYLPSDSALTNMDEDTLHSFVEE